MTEEPGSGIGKDLGVDAVENPDGGGANDAPWSVLIRKPPAPFP